MYPEQKPRVRIRTNLSTVQMNDEQKDVIDRAYSLFVDVAQAKMSKGAFLSALCLSFLQGKTQIHNQSEEPEPTPPSPPVL